MHLILPINAIYKNVISYCINKMTTYVSLSYSLSSVMVSYLLAQMPRHSPQPVEQSNPALRQKQRIVSHPILQLHRTTFSTALGARIAAMFKFEDLFQLVIPSSCCDEPLKQHVWVHLKWFIVDSDSTFAAPLTSISSLLLILRCPRLPCCQHSFLSQ